MANNNDNTDNHDDDTIDDSSLESDDDHGETHNDSAIAAAAAADAKAIERQARAQGWRPEDEFKGEGTWVDAATFVDRGNKFKKRQEKEIESLKATVAASAESLKALAKFHKEAMAGKAKELDSAIRKAKMDRQAAIRNGDDEDAVHLDDRIDTLNDEKKKLLAEAEEPAAKGKPNTPETQAEVVTDNPVLNAWMEDGNEWFRDDPKLRAYALAAGEDIRKDNPNLRNRAFLDAVKAQMIEDFPKKFATGNSNRAKAGTVEGGSPAANGATAGRTFRDLPAADRDLCRTFVKDGLMTEKQFLADYNWS